MASLSSTSLVMEALCLIITGQSFMQTPHPAKLITSNFLMIAEELNQAGIYSSVKYANDVQQEPAEVAFRGRLRSTEWKRRLYTYLLGPVGVVFWMVGLPMSETTTDLELDLRLTPVNEPNKVLWSMRMDFEGKQFDSPYYGLEDAVVSYPMALQEALKPAVADLVGLANQDPKRLLPR
jgi:hypothetical protein